MQLGCRRFVSVIHVHVWRQSSIKSSFALRLFAVSMIGPIYHCAIWTLCKGIAKPQCIDSRFDKETCQCCPFACRPCGLFGVQHAKHFLAYTKRRKRLQVQQIVVPIAIVSEGYPSSFCLDHKDTDTSDMHGSRSRSKPPTQVVGCCLWAEIFFTHVYIFFVSGIVFEQTHLCLSRSLSVSFSLFLGEWFLGKMFSFFEFTTSRRKFAACRENIGQHTCSPVCKRRKMCKALRHVRWFSVTVSDSPEGLPLRSLQEVFMCSWHSAISSPIILLQFDQNIKVSSEDRAEISKIWQTYLPQFLQLVSHVAS